MERRANVLVIDSDVMVLEALRLELGSNGLAIEAYADVGEALRALAGGGFDAVVAGVGVLDRVRRQGGTVPVVLVADGASEAAALDGLRRGAFDYVVRPFRAGKLVARVRRALEVRGLREEVARLRAAARGALPREVEEG